MKRPFLYIALFFATGIAVGTHLMFSRAILLLLAALFAVLSLTSLRNKILAHASLYLAIFFLGLFAYHNFNILPHDHISVFAGNEEKRAVIKGIITDDPIIATTFYGTKRASLLLDVHHVKDGSVWRKASGLVKADLYAVEGMERLAYGDEVVFDGILMQPNSLKNPGLFDYVKYLRNKKIYSIFKVGKDSYAGTVDLRTLNPIRGAAYRLRRKMRLLVERHFAQPYSGFLKTILLGDRSALPAAINDEFIKTGTVHILAISGLQVGLIGAILLFILGAFGVPRKINFIVTGMMLVFYSFLTGANPPIMRATIMFLIFAAGYLIERESDPINSLAIAGLLILSFNPNALFDPSFQLSFASILSTMVFAPKIDIMLKMDRIDLGSRGGRVMSYFLRSVSVSTAAWLGAAPIVSFYFNITSPVAILANMIVIPIIFVLTLSAFLFLLAGQLVGLLAVYFAVGITMLAKFLFAANSILARMPFAYFRTPAPSAFHFLLYYLILIFFLAAPGVMAFKGTSIHKKHLMMALIFLFNIAIWKYNISSEKDILKIIFFDVGQGDSAFMEFPGKGTILLDGGTGGDEEGFNIGKTVIAPYLWNRGIKRLDAIVVSHFHEDHLGGVIYILENFKIGSVMDNGAGTSPDNKLYDRYRKILNERRIQRIIVRDGDEINSFDRARIVVLNPPDGDILDSNDNSMVLKLIYGKNSILFGGDITETAMERLFFYREFLESDILKVPHHGGLLGRRDIVKNFIKDVSPEVSIISVGKNNRYKAPSRQTLDILTSLNSTCYKTDEVGAITVLLEKEGLEVKVLGKKN